MVTNQAYLFLIFIVNGIIIGVLFDFFRILRKTIKTKNIITYFQDILFWFLTGFIILYSTFTFNNGEIRLFMFIAILVGVIFYMTIISSYIIKINVTIINFIKNIIQKIFNIFITPFRWIYKFVKKILYKPLSFVKKLIIKSGDNLNSEKENFIKILQKNLNLNKEKHLSR